MAPVVGFRVLSIDEVTNMDLVGARVYDLNDEWIGEVSELLVQSNQITDAVIDVGGFLGLGEKPVVVTLTNLSFQQGENAMGDVRVYVEMTEAELNAMPAYE